MYRLVEPRIAPVRRDAAGDRLALLRHYGQRLAHRLPGYEAARKRSAIVGLEIGDLLSDVVERQPHAITLGVDRSTEDIEVGDVLLRALPGSDFDEVLAELVIGVDPHDSDQVFLLDHTGHLSAIGRTVAELMRYRKILPAPEGGASDRAGLEEPPVTMAGPAITVTPSDQGAFDEKVLARRRYASQPEVQAALEANGGWLRLEAAVAGELAGMPQAHGGLLLTRQATGPADRAGLFIMDSDLAHPDLERLAAVIKPGATAEAMLQALPLLRARAGDAVVFEQDDDLPLDPARIRALIVARLVGAASLPRAVVGNKAQVAAMPITAFQLPAHDAGLPDVALPDVVILGVVTTFRGDADELTISPRPAERGNTLGCTPPSRGRLLRSPGPHARTATTYAARS